MSREHQGAPENVSAGSQPVLTKVHSGYRVEDGWERPAGADSRVKEGRLTSSKRRSGGEGKGNEEETESGLEDQQLFSQSLEAAEV